MAELLAANQITIAKVLDGEKGEMSAEQLAQLNQASEDASQAKSDIANLEIGGRNYVVKKDSFSATVNGITLDYDGEVYHIYGTNTKTDAAYGIGGNFIEKPNVFEPNVVYTVSTTTPLPSGLYLGINTRNSSGTGIQAGSNAWLYGDGNKTSNTFTCTQDTNGTLIVFFGVSASCGTVDVTFKIKLEKGNRATDWTPAPEDVEAGIDNAAKVATNFINYDSTNGLVLGNKESGSWVGYRTQIDNDSFNVLDENGSIIASYGSNEVELGKGNPSAIIRMCDGKAYIKNYIVGSENTSVFCGQNTTAVGEWDGASESYAFFKQGYAYIGQSSSSIKFSSLSPNKNDIIMEGRTITINGQLALGTALSIANGGTGATSLAGAQENLGIKANSERIAAIATDLNVQKSRIDTFTSLPEGSTSGNAELTDIRVGADGTTYDTAGNAVRGQIGELKSDLSNTQRDIVGCEKLKFISGYGIATGDYSVGETVDITPYSYSTLSYYIEDCKKGDVFIVSGTGGVRSHLYAILDTNNKLIRKSGDNATLTNYVVTIEVDGKFVINNLNTVCDCYKISRGIINSRLSKLDRNIKTTEVETIPYKVQILGDSLASYIKNTSDVARGFICKIQGGYKYHIVNPKGDRFKIVSSSYDPLFRFSNGATSLSVDGNFYENDNADFVDFATRKTDNFITVYCSNSSQDIEVLEINKGAEIDKDTIEISNYKLNDPFNLGYSIFDSGKNYDSNIELINNGTPTLLKSLFDVYDDLVTRYPEYVTKEMFFVDGAGMQNYLYHFKNTSDSNENKEIFITCGTHGYEYDQQYHCAYLMKEICDNWKTDEALKTLRWNVDFTIVPCLNMYGYLNQTRKNENGVDLNRNYGEGWELATGTDNTDPASEYYKGSAPFSEIQTQSVRDYINKNAYKILFAIDYHESGSYTYIATSPKYKNKLCNWQRTMESWLHELAGYPEIPSDRNTPLIFDFQNLGSASLWYNTVIPSVILETTISLKLSENNKLITEHFSESALCNLLLSVLRIN